MGGAEWNPAAIPVVPRSAVGASGSCEAQRAHFARVPARRLTPTQGHQTSGLCTTLPHYAAAATSLLLQGRRLTRTGCAALAPGSVPSSSAWWTAAPPTAPPSPSERAAQAVRAVHADLGIVPGRTLRVAGCHALPCIRALGCAPWPLISKRTATRCEQALGPGKLGDKPPPCRCWPLCPLQLAVAGQPRRCCPIQSPSSPLSPLQLAVAGQHAEGAHAGRAGAGAPEGQRSRRAALPGHVRGGAVACC